MVSKTGNKIAKKAIIVAIKNSGRDIGSTFCPVCKRGNLSYQQYRGHKDHEGYHIHARCSTPGCIDLKE